MFGAKNVSEVDYDTLISAKTEVIGDLKVSGAIHVGGTVKGNIVAEKGSKATILVSEKGRIEGCISAPNVIINGEVNGDIHAFEYIELAKKARINGDVYYTSMEMVLGAQVNGQLHHGSAPEAPVAVVQASQAELAKVD